MIKVYFLRYKLGSFYYFNKHNPFDMNTGMSTVYVIERILRGERFFKKRDKSFDFMRVGEVELFEYEDPLP